MSSCSLLSCWCLSSLLSRLEKFSQTSFQISFTGIPRASFDEITALKDFETGWKTMFFKVIGWLWNLKHVSFTKLLSKFTFTTIQLSQKEFVFTLPWRTLYLHGNRFFVMSCVYVEHHHVRSCNKHQFFTTTVTSLFTEIHKIFHLLFFFPILEL